MDIAAYLRDVTIFQGLRPTAAARLASEVVEARFAAGTKIVHRGEASDSMYLLVAGQVQVPVLNAQRQPQFVAQLGPKQIFGEMALLTGEPRSADVIATTDCHCLVFPRDAVQRVLHAYPDVAQFLTTILGERLAMSRTIRQVGKYKLVGELGRGGMSIVYEGIHPTLDRAVAIKMLSHEKTFRPDFIARFRNEAKIISRLRHPHIVEVFDTEEAYATFFIVMERIPGMPLDRLIQARGRLGYGQVRDVIAQIASALQLAHSHGVVHRDIKPSNIVVAPQGHVKLMDFGLALDAAGAAKEEPGMGAGTPSFMAPEQIKGEAVDGRTDIYALGLVAYHMLTGAPPFLGKLYEVLSHQRNTPVPSPRTADPGIPNDLEAFVARATHKEPAARFQSCEEILAYFGAAEPRGPALNELAVRTLTFVYAPAQEAVVEGMIEDCKRRADEAESLLLY